MQTSRYFRLALLGATLLSTPVLAATNDQANNPPPANNTAAATTPAPANNMANTMTPATNANNRANSTAANNAPANNATAANNGKGPDGTLHKYDNDWRASKLVGANVYNEQGQTVASINDLLVTDDGHIDRAVLSTGGGILGVGSKLVTVPFSQLKFQPSINNNTNNAVAVNNNNSNNAPLPRTEAPAGNGNPNGNAGTTANGQTAPTSGTMVATNNNTNNSSANNNNPENFSIVLPGATQDSLKNEQEFKYAAD